MGGFFVGCIAFGIWAWPLKNPELKTNSWRGVEKTQTMIDGVPTFAGWMDYLLLTGMLGLLGLIGGAVFWWFLSKFYRLGAFNWFSISTNKLTWRQKMLTLLPFILLAGVLSIPAITKDRSCHNLFRNADTKSVSPRTIFKIQTDWSDWMKIQTVLTEFATSEALSFRNDSESYQGGLRSLHVSLCNDTGTKISIHDYKGSNLSAIEEIPFSIAIYSLNNDPAWPKLASKLQEYLKTQWPGKIEEQH